MNSFDYEGENDPDFDESKADRNKDGKISDWERSVGNAVAKSMREQKENKSAEEFEDEEMTCDELLAHISELAYEEHYEVERANSVLLAISETAIRKKPVEVGTYDAEEGEEFGAEEGAFYQLEVKYNMEDGWEHIGDFSHKEEAIKTYQELKNKHPEVRFLEVLGTDDDGYEWREYDDESNDFKNAESFDAEFSKGDMLNLKKYIDYPMRWIDKNIRPSSDAKARKLEQKSKGQIPTKKTPDSFRQKIETPNWFKAVQVGILASVIGVMYFKDSGASEEPEEPEEQKEE